MPQPLKSIVHCGTTPGTSSATITWRWPGEPTHRQDGTPDGSGRFTTTIEGLPRGEQVSFQGSAVSAANTRGESRTVTREVPRCKGS